MLQAAALQKPSRGCGLGRPARFFVTGLPRSRTAWFAWYFSQQKGVWCHHELMNRCLSREAFYEGMAPTQQHASVGNSDCGLVLSDFQARWPRAPTVIVHRPIAEVSASLARIGLNIPAPVLEELEERNRSLSGLHVRFEDIDEAMPAIHAHLLNECPDTRKLRKAVEQNVQLAEVTGNPAALAVWRN